MQMINQQSTTIAGPGAVLGEIIHTGERPIDALKTMLFQLRKTREWNVAAISEAVDTIEKALQGIELTLECVECNMEAAIQSLEKMQADYALLTRKVAHGCTDANCSQCDQ
jgi:hypothetical protein